jgi:hypothetical protein
VPFRFLGIFVTSVVGIASEAASAASSTDARGYAVAAIIAASCTGAATVIGAVVSGLVRLRQSNRRKRPSRAELLRKRAELDKQLGALEDDKT